MALYRAYRPTCFAEVVGQQAATEALTQGLEAGRIGHALLISGPHGVGKTTLARLVAQCLSCSQAPTSEPCRECPSCQAFAAGNHPDLLEMDAASHRGVDDARAIRERLTVAPMLGSTTVLIIDEAHMLTREAQNALLKTLEEPPPGVYFLFATTAPDKLLNTVRSRCQHYRLQSPSTQQLVEALQRVIHAENIAIEEAAVDAICAAASGSYRDGLSLLEQVASSGAQPIGVETVRSCSGLPGTEVWETICIAVAGSHADLAMGAVQQLVADGFDLRSALSDFERYLRFVLYAQAGANPSSLQAAPSTAESVQRVAEQLPAPALWKLVEGIEAAYEVAAYGGSAALALESRVAQAAASDAPLQPVSPSPAAASAAAEPVERPPASSDKEKAPAAANAKRPPAASGAKKPPVNETAKPAKEAPSPKAPPETAVAPLAAEGELPGPAVAAAAFPLLRLALRTHYPEQYLALRTAWARYDDKRLVVQMERQLERDQSDPALAVLRRMVDGSVRLAARERVAAPKNKKAKLATDADPASLLADMGLVPLEGERRSDQEGVSQD